MRGKEKKTSIANRDKLIIPPTLSITTIHVLPKKEKHSVKVKRKEQTQFVI